MKKRSKQVWRKQQSGFLSGSSQKELPEELGTPATEMTREKNRVTNMQEITQMDLENWQDGFWDKYDLLPKAYKIAAAFFIIVGILAVLASLILFPVTESAPGSREQIIGAFLLGVGPLLVLVTALGHYFHIRSIKGECGLDMAVTVELTDSKAPAKNLNGVVKKKHPSSTQKKSHKTAETMGITENSLQKIQENKHKPDEFLAVSKPKKKKHAKKNSRIESEDRVVNNDVPVAPSFSAPLVPPPVTPIAMASEVKRTGLANSAKDVPVFSSKASSAIQARGAALAGLFRPSKDSLLKSVKPSLAGKLA